MKIEIHSLKSIEARALQPFAPKTIIISIGDTDAQPPNLVNKPDHFLRLTFEDITLDTIREEFQLPESLASSDSALVEYLLSRNVRIFSDEQARQIAEFIFTHIRNADVLICQCHYGESRSAGCAAAVAEYFYGNGIDIFADERYYPNKLVYKKVLKALKEFGREHCNISAESNP